MRPTSIAFLVGSLSLVGVFPFVGFFSKEQILGAAFSKPDDTVVHFLWFIGFVTALITGFYTGRMWWLSFWGKPSPQRPVEHPHEAPPVMFVPVAMLAVLATVGGLLQTKALGFGTDEVSNFLSSAVGPERWEGGGAEIDYKLQAPQWQFLCYLCDYKGLLMHGSGDPNIAEFEPRHAGVQQLECFDQE